MYSPNGAKTAVQKDQATKISIEYVNSHFTKLFSSTVLKIKDTPA
jgi:hypothetical protein